VVALLRVLLAAGTAVAVACGARDPLSPTPGPIAVGTWGGDSAGVIVDNAGVHVHIKCTLGNVPATIVAGADGRFDVAGSYVLRAYPVQIGPELPARFVGEVLGDRLTLTVTVNDTVENQTVTVGPATVRLGREPRMANCPICRPASASAGTFAWMRKYQYLLGLALLLASVRYIVTQYHVISRRNSAGGPNGRERLVRP
jgi:hypothetical protein